MAQKLKFSIKDLVTFTEEIFNGKFITFVVNFTYFGLILQNSAQTVLFHKIYTPGKYVELRYFTK